MVINTRRRAELQTNKRRCRVALNLLARLIPLLKIRLSADGVIVIFRIFSPVGLKSAGTKLP